MVENLRVFLSNRLEVLYHDLKISLFGSSSTPFLRRIVVVYGPAMKSWLMLKMAQDPELNVTMGIEFIYLNQIFERLLNFSDGFQGYFPTHIELALACEQEIMAIIQNYHELTEEEKDDWKPLFHYLKIDHEKSNFSNHLSRKVEKRLTSLSQKLANLFLDYGRYAREMLTDWEKLTSLGWQPRLWRKLFSRHRDWIYPIKALEQAIKPSSFCTLHFFSISFITSSEFSFLNQLSQYLPISYSSLSPCAVFWSDIRSDKENAYLQAFWQRKIKSDSQRMTLLEDLLKDRNPLLANFGRIGREMATQIEESQAETESYYVLPEHIQSLNPDLEGFEDLHLTETQGPLTLLHAVQADLLLMRNPQEKPPYHFNTEQDSIQLHIAPNRRREVEILYNQLIELMLKDASLSFRDIIVMVPHISEYAPYIQSLFGSETSPFDFQILDLGMQKQNHIVHGFLQLIALAESRWDVTNLLQLFEHSAFQQRHQITPSDYSVIKFWIEHTGIRWGDDWSHRNEILKRNHCQQEMVDSTIVGTWDYGLSQLLQGLIIAQELQPSIEIPSRVTVDFSQTDLLGKFIRILQSLRDDLVPLQDRSQMSIEDWTNYLDCLLESYFQPHFDKPQSIEEYEDLKSQLESLKQSGQFFKETVFPFCSVKVNLLSLLENRSLTYHEDHVQSVRFCSLMPLRSIPARVIAILGLQEGVFPRIFHHSSLNQTQVQQFSDYSPSPADYDRYLFLEALHSAQDYLLLSYQGYSLEDNKELQASIVVQELYSYLDKFYLIQEKKVSETCIYHHPLDSFDRSYFQANARLKSYSINDYRAAVINEKHEKTKPFSFLDHFLAPQKYSSTFFENQNRLDIKYLSAAIRNPIKFHLNKTLEIYLQSQEDRQVKLEEELVVSPLDKFQLKSMALKQPIDWVLKQAEKEGKLPFGLFKEVASKRFKVEMNEIYENLQKHFVDLNQIFQIEFCTSCAHPIQIDENHWLFPAAKLTLDNGCQLSIVGNLPHVSPRGLLFLGKGTLVDAWKAWPQFLLYCYATTISPVKFEPHLIFSLAKNSKKSFFEDPFPYLKKLLDYYGLCLQQFSPLIPDWIPLFLEEDVKGLENKMRELCFDTSRIHQISDLKWILNKDKLPNAKDLIGNWKPQIERLMSDLIHFWYPQKSKNFGDL